MDAIYPRFARADAVFYEDPGRASTAGRIVFAPDAERDWSGWTHRDDGNWAAWFPPGAGLPEQGWKIHVSASLEVADEILRHVSAYCHARTMAFKHLPHRESLFATNAKDADRASAGKFITMYPTDEDELRHALDTLDARIGGMPGPYILSDLRWRNGPLSVRYGAFLHRTAPGEDGYEVFALRHPDGRLVEDVRAPGFTPPDWVELPGFLQEQRDALGGDEPPPGFPRVLGAMHHSNAGGVYDAEDHETGTRIVVKEARPHTGITPDGRDAVERLLDEEATLRALDGLPVAAVHGAFTLHGHRFLLLERVEGHSVQSSVVPRNPSIHADSSPSDYADHRQWALDVAARVDAAISLIHDAGFSHGDLHPGNAILREDGSIVLLDFEMARPAEDDAPVVVGAPGFIAPDRRGGIAADRYGLACIKIFVFYPLTPLLALDPRKADDLLSAAADTFALDDEWIAAVHRDLALADPLVTEPADAARIDDAVRRWDVHDATAVRALQSDILAELAASATPSRTDRFWPGDPQQFAEDGVGLAHGVAGVLFAQSQAGAAPDEQALAWLDETLRRPADSRRPHRPGLWDGLAGVAWLHRLLGRHDRADEEVAQLRATDLAALGADLYGGLPGVGLVLLDEADADPSLLAKAREIGRLLRRKHDARPPVAADASARRVRTGSGGLLHGATGTALFALRLYERTGDEDALRLAEDALDYDLAHCRLAVDGSLQMNEGWRLLPYLAAGSAGVGLVAAQTLPYTSARERYHEAIDQIASAALVDFTIEPGVFQGRAGLILFLSAIAQQGLSTTRTDEALAHHVAQLRLHALRRPHGIAFPGQGLLRVSCDFATGSAGVLAALETYARALDPASSSSPSAVVFPLLMPSAAASSPWPHAAARPVERR